MTHSVPGKRILILDNREAPKMYQLQLMDEGYHLTTTRSEGAALELHKENPFDLVILELGSSEKNSFETLVALRRVKWTTRFIAIYNPRWIPAKHVLQMAGHLGFHGAIDKPFSAKKMLTVIRKALELES